MHEDSRYCLYACPLKGTEIDEATLQSIKAEVDTLEIGEIRYDSVQSCGYDYYIVDPDTGRHILTGQRDMDSVMEISDHYTASSCSANRYSRQERPISLIVPMP